MELHLASETLQPDELTSKEHYSNRMDAVREYFGFPEERNNPDQDKTGYGITHSVIEWFDESTPRDKLSRPLDVIYVRNENPDKSFWIPWIEYKLLEEVKKHSVNGVNLEWGYIHGRRYHLGKFSSNSRGMASVSNHSGYQIWIECQRDKEPQLTHI